MNFHHYFQDGNSALHLAVMGGHYNIAVMLLNSDCDLEMRNTEGWTALQLAHKLDQRTGEPLIG